MFLQDIAMAFLQAATDGADRIRCRADAFAPSGAAGIVGQDGQAVRKLGTGRLFA
jgi:hypothetical protein